MEPKSHPTIPIQTGENDEKNHLCGADSLRTSIRSFRRHSYADVDESHATHGRITGHRSVDYHDF
jgi:hypothetical protein